MDTRLDRAIAGLRDGGEDRLSDAARNRIVEAAWQESRDAAEVFEPRFRPARWLVLVGAVPVAAAALVILSSNLGDGTSHEARFTGAEKNGDEVVFTIADGRGPHTVVKSTDPTRFNPAAAASTDGGRYTDQANNGPVLVFYRID